MSVVVTTDLLSTVARMGLASLRNQIQLVKRTNREYEKDISAATPMSTVNVVVPAPVTAVAVTPGAVHPNDTAAVTPTIVPITLDQWYRAPFAFSDKQQAQVDRGIIPMQINEAIIGLVEKIESNVWLNYKKFYGVAGTPGTTPFATTEDEFIDADKVANDQKMPGTNRAMLLNTAANANWKRLQRVYNKNYTDIGVEPAWTQLVPTHTAGTAVGATTDAAGYALGVKTVTLASAGTGSILVGDIITFAGDTQTYTVTSGDSSVAGGGTISFEPGLKVAITTAATDITVKDDHVANLLLHPNAIAFAMAPMQQGARVPGQGAMEATVVDPDSGLALRLTYFRQFYQDEWSFDALWGSAVPRPELGVRIFG
jgi:hypothetical protein